MSSVSFDSKSDYLLFVSQWKLVYKGLSAHIRLSKHLQKELSREMAKKPRLTVEQMASLKDKVKLYVLPMVINKFPLPQQTQWTNYSQVATDLLQLRRDSKIEAGIRREAELTKKIA